MKLLEKIKKRIAKVGVIGLGYLGLPLAIQIVKARFKLANGHCSLDGGQFFLSSIPSMYRGLDLLFMDILKKFSTSSSSISSPFSICWS